MINSYFLLYHSLNYVKGDDTLLLNFKDKNFDEIAALILSLTSKKLVTYLELEEFKKLSKKIILNGFLSSSSHYEFCFIVLTRVLSQNALLAKYITIFDYLHSKNLLTTQDRSKLYAIFKSITIDVEQIDKEENNFITNKDILLSTLPNVKNLLNSTKLRSDLDDLKSYIFNQTFSIGITGVMNVGKSTFINSLLSKELLGSSVVAETANLTVLKYSDKPYTKVRFFNKGEFEEMLHTFDNEKERTNYLSKLKSTLNIDKYVQKDSLKIDIKSAELHKYTSASDSSSLCHIVKDVEIGVDLDFLKDSIEIVDTPGLDDSLIIRESVTQSYVSNCDLLIHLMNVNQSATQKDVDFIIDCILNQNITSILILLTKADNITEQELLEVIRYTKNSIENQLSLLDSSTNVSKVFSSLKFLSVSAKVALDVRKEDKQHKQAQLIKKSGILEVENYLFKTLFSKNSKSKQIVETSSRKLKSIIKSQIKIYHYNLVLYSKNEEALEDELIKFNKTKEQNNDIYKKIDIDIKFEYDEFLKYLTTLDLDMDSELSELKSKLLDRVISEITYTLKKDKVELKELQLKMIIDKSLNHGFIDIVRGYKYKIEQKIDSIAKNIELSFKTYNIHIEDIEDKFSLQSLFEKNSNSILSTNTKMILKELLKLIKGIKLTKIQTFKEMFSSTLEQEFIYINTHLQTTLQELNSTVSDTFFKALRVPIERLESELLEHGESLEKQIFLLQDKDNSIEELKIDTQNKINSLEAIMESL